VSSVLLKVDFLLQNMLVKNLLDVVKMFISILYTASPSLTVILLYNVST